MSRDTHVYLVQRDSNVLAAFTVKYEMVSYLERFALLSDLKVTRLRAGEPEFPQAELDVKELTGWA